MFQMSDPSPSGSGTSGRPPSSQPLSYQTVIDPKPRPFKPGVFDESLYSEWRAHNLSDVVEVLDALDSEATSTLGAEEFETSSSASLPNVKPYREREIRVTTPGGSLSFDSVRYSFSQADLDQLRMDYSVPNQVSLRVPDEGELPSSPPAGEVALNRWFLKSGMRLPLAPFVRHLLYNV